eukprot:10389899-Ditylum_brightwellii.AAC.1
MQDQASAFGLCFFGDGAMIQRRPLMNALGAYYRNPAVVLDIVNCAKHLETGGKKTGKYIAERFCPHIEWLDPKHEDMDLVCFDGASNVKIGGKDLSKLALVWNLIVKYCSVCNVWKWRMTYTICQFYEDQSGLQWWSAN